jgi:hypothetical protein
MAATVSVIDNGTNRGVAMPFAKAPHCVWLMVTIFSADFTLCVTEAYTVRSL